MDEPSSNVADAPRRRSAARRKKSGRNRAIALGLTPLVVGAVVFAAAFVVRSATADRFAHETTVLGLRDSANGAWDNRNALAEVLTTEADARMASTSGLQIEVISRFNNLLDIVVEADDQATATSVADEIVGLGIDERAAAATLVLRTRVEALEDQLVETKAALSEAEAVRDAAGDQADAAVRDELQRNVNSLVESRNYLERQIEQLGAEIEGTIVPVDVVSSSALGVVAPKPARDAALAGAVAAIVAAVLLAALATRPS